MPSCNVTAEDQSACYVPVVAPVLGSDVLVAPAAPVAAGSAMGGNTGTTWQNQPITCIPGAVSSFLSNEELINENGPRLAEFCAKVRSCSDHSARILSSFTTSNLAGRKPKRCAAFA